MDIAHASSTNTYNVTSGVDNSDGLMDSFNPAEITRLSIGGSDNDRIQSNGNWPINGTYDESKYIEFVFNPNLDSNAIIESVNLNHEYYETVKLTNAKLEVWDGNSFINYPINLPITSGTINEILQNVNILNTINTVNKLNGLKVRFLAYRDTNAATVKTSHDLLNLVVTYSIPEIIPPPVVIVEPEPDPIVEPTPDPVIPSPTIEPDPVIDPVPEKEADPTIEPEPVTNPEPENTTDTNTDIDPVVPVSNTNLNNNSGGEVVPLEYLGNKNININTNTTPSIASTSNIQTEPMLLKEEVIINKSIEPQINTEEVKAGIVLGESTDASTEEVLEPQNPSNLALVASTGNMIGLGLKSYWFWVILLLLIFILVLVSKYQKSK